MKKWLGIGIALSLFAVSALAGEAAAYQAGTYEGTAMGFGGEVKATVTFDENAITEVVLEGASETSGIGSQALEQLPEKILEAQSAEVEGISGASFSSKAVKQAVQACIDQAAGVSGEETAVSMKPGTYQGQGIGFRITEPLNVSVTVSEDKIEAIEVDQVNTSDTKAFVQTVVDLLVPRMLEYQSVSMDAISGATATSNAVRQAVEAAVTEAIVANGGDASSISAFYKSYPKVEASEELTADVLVVGLGGSGMAAALSSAEQGLDVLAIDKAAKWGGNCVLTSGPMAINVPSQVEAEIEEWNDPVSHEKVTKKAGEDLIDKEGLYQAWLEYTTNEEGEQQAKPEMVRILMDESGYTDDWLTQYGFQFGPASGFAGNSWAAYTPISGGKALTEGFFAEAMGHFMNDFGGRTMLETEAYDLIVEDGVVTGAKARSVVDGTEYVIHAKAVVLATGGFAGSGEMEEKYLTNTYFPLQGEWKLFGMQQNKGNMIEAALENGAAPFNMSVAPMVHVGGVDGFLPGFETVEIEGRTNSAGRPAVWSQGDIPLVMAISANTLAVGKDAKRFTSEARLSMFDPWIAGPHFYSIYGSDQVEKIIAEGFSEIPGGPSMTYLGYGTAIPTGIPMDQGEIVLEKAIEAGFVYKADTIAELAEMMGLDGAVLEETVEAYNGYCESGEDPEFAKPANYLVPITGAPYYGLVGSSYCYSTCGALNINEKFQVLKEDESPLEGLYAVGTDSMGVLFSETKAYVTYGGGAMGWAFTSGRLVGVVLADELSE